MSIHLQCPACGLYGSDNSSPDARWGMLHDELEMERALDVGRDAHGDDQDSYSFHDGDGRRSFECPCGRAIWIADRGLPRTGRWFTTDLADAAQQLAEPLDRRNLSREAAILVGSALFASFRWY